MILRKEEVDGVVGDRLQAKREPILDGRYRSLLQKGTTTGKRPLAGQHLLETQMPHAMAVPRCAGNSSR